MVNIGANCQCALRMQNKPAEPLILQRGPCTFGVRGVGSALGFMPTGVLTLVSNTLWSSSKEPPNFSFILHKYPRAIHLMMNGNYDSLG